MILKLLADIAKKKATAAKAAFEKEKKRVDDSWPLGIKIGRTVVLEETPWLIADGLDVIFPGTDNVIKAVGIANAKIAPGTKIYRCYLQRVTGGEESILQIAVEEKSGAVEECMLYRVGWEIYPKNSSEWDEWRNEEDGRIGYKDLTTPSDKTYERVTPRGGDMVSPFPWRENLTDDPYVESIMHIDYESAIYGREVGEITENLLVSEVKENDQSFIRILVGIPVDVAFIKIL